MIGEIVRYKAHRGDSGHAQRFLVTAVAFDQMDRRFVLLAINVTKNAVAIVPDGPYRGVTTPDHGEYGDTITLVADSMRRETAKERDVEPPPPPPPPPPPTAIPGAGPGCGR